MATISAPKNSRDEVQTDAVQIIVLLGDEEGNPPTLDDEIHYMKVERIGHYANGGRDDVITLHVDMDAAEERLVDTETPTGYNRQIEIRTLDEDGEPKKILGWGFLARQPQTIDDRNEGYTVEARLDQNLFGNALTEYPVCFPIVDEHHPSGKELLRINRKLIFNPEIDEIIEPNMSDKVRENGDLTTDELEDDPFEPPPWRYIIDPESMRTEAARTLQDQTRSLWTLGEAVYFLCWWLNPDETYIKNPTLEELAEVLSDRDDLIKNIEIPFGLFLPGCLDALLVPLEYGWQIVHSLETNDDDEEVRVSRMRFYARGKGVKKQLHMQRPDKKKSLKKTNVDEFRATYSLVDLANRVEVYGALKRREATFILVPGWDDADDELDLSDLEKDQPTAIAKPDVGRKWVLNESGDYIGRRTEITEAFDIASLFTDGSTFSFRRRRFLPCISQHVSSGGDDKESNRFRVDWWDVDEPDAFNPADITDPAWFKVKWPFSVLEKECGIYFEGPTPPDALWDRVSSGSTVAVRITASIEADDRIVGIADRRPESPQGLDLALIIDKSTKFQDRSVLRPSLFQDAPSTARNDQIDIDAYAEKVRDIEDAVQISCSVVLEGIEHPEYEIGDLIDKVEGRNLVFDGYTPDPDSEVEPRRPQIVGFNYLLGDVQKLEILMESFKQERPQIGKGGLL